MATKTVTGGGVTVTMSAPSFPPSMSGNCEDFSCWMVDNSDVTAGTSALLIRAKWTAGGSPASADVGNADWISMQGGSGDIGVPGAGIFA